VTIIILYYLRVKDIKLIIIMKAIIIMIDSIMHPIGGSNDIAYTNRRLWNMTISDILDYN